MARRGKGWGAAASIKGKQSLMAIYRDIFIVAFFPSRAKLFRGKVMSEIDTKDLIGKIFDSRYQIIGVIGRGGMGVVYKAVHIAMNQVVALKVLSRAMTGDDTYVQRFYQEARASSRLKHPNTIRVFDFGRAEEGHLYIAMEYLDGETLSNLLKREGALPPRRALNIAKQVAKSLAEAHAQGLVHRDLKPDNVFLTRVYGEEDFVKVLDFGIAKFLESSPDYERLTIVGGVIGTPAYVSPEQGLGKTLDGRSDLYSLGVILYEMLCGSPPFKAETPIATIMRHIHEEPPPLTYYKPDLVIPASVRDLVFWLLEKDRTKRPASPEIVVQTIDRVLLELPVVESKGPEPSAVLDKALGEQSKANEEGIVLEDLTEIIPGLTPDAPTKVVQKKEEPKASQKTEITKTEEEVKPVVQKLSGRWRVGLLVASVILVAGAGGVVTGLHMGEPYDRSQHETLVTPVHHHVVMSPAPSNPVPKKRVVFRVSTEPDDALIEIEGGGVAKGPVFLVLSSDEPPVRLKFSAAGYIAKTAELGAEGILASGQKELRFVLEKVPHETQEQVIGKPGEASQVQLEGNAAASKVESTNKPKPTKPTKKRKQEVLDWE